MGFYSIVLLAKVDFDYKFTYINVGVGCQGCISNWGVYINSRLKEAFLNNEFNFPPFLNNEFNPYQALMKMT